MKKICLSVLIVFSVVTVWSQSKNAIPLIGSDAPSFKANTTNGKLNFPKDFGDNWKILLSHPKDFTPVCTSEIFQLANMQDGLEKLGVKVAVISIDNLSQHEMWIKSIEEIEYQGNSVKINFPLIADEDAKISKRYGMLHNTASTTRDVRGVFIISPDNKIQSVNFYPMSIGRNLDEIERIIVALQTTNESQVLTPANWEKGDDVLIPYAPYLESDLEENPELADKYYNVGNNMWFKKMQD